MWLMDWDEVGDFQPQMGRCDGGHFNPSDLLQELTTHFICCNTTHIHTVRITHSGTCRDSNNTRAWNASMRYYQSRWQKSVMYCRNLWHMRSVFWVDTCIQPENWRRTNTDEHTMIHINSTTMIHDSSLNAGTNTDWTWTCQKCSAAVCRLSLSINRNCILI